MDLQDRTVVITGGKYQGRIGFVDADEGGKVLDVFLGRMLLTKQVVRIRRANLARPSSQQLLARAATLETRIAYSELVERDDNVEEYLQELNLIWSTMCQWMLYAHKPDDGRGKSVFLSHSSKDKQPVRAVAIDLVALGHRPWLDEWQIKAAQSIPTRISEGLDECDAVVLFLSKAAIGSHWVEREWQAKYWEEVKDNRIRVIPALLEDCSIPKLLGPKKYADFRNGYDRGLAELLAAIE